MNDSLELLSLFYCNCPNERLERDNYVLEDAAEEIHVSILKPFSRVAFQLDSVNFQEFCSGF